MLTAGLYDVSIENENGVSNISKFEINDGEQPQGLDKSEMNR